MADKVEDVAGRLYGLPLEDFTRERDAAARELRAAKERDVAAVVAKLPKPTQAAWAGNALARERRDLVDALLDAGEELRAAQEAAVSGEGADALRSAAAAERAAVDALVEAAKELRPGGRAPSAATLDRLRTTLHAAAADDDVRAALDRGRLVADVQGGGAWGGLFGVGEEAAPTKPKPEPKAKRQPAARDDASTKERERERREREEEARRERERRRDLEAELREARAERRSRDRALERAERDAERAARRLEDALAAVEDAREQAEESQGDVERAREAASDARDTVARLEEQLD